jgi:hypothetical protein
VDTGAEYTAFRTDVATSLGLSMSLDGRWESVSALGSPGGIKLKFFKYISSDKLRAHRVLV